MKPIQVWLASVDDLKLWWIKKLMGWNEYFYERTSKETDYLEKKRKKEEAVKCFLFLISGHWLY
jgi:hypothetical protein